MPNLIEWINDLTYDKKGILNKDTKKDYVPYVINRGLSNHMDCIMYAQQMNIYHGLPIEMQYDFYLYGISKAKRYGKWAKKTKLDKDIEVDLELISEYYDVSRERAMVYMEILNSEELEHIRDMFRGSENVKRSRKK